MGRDPKANDSASSRLYLKHKTEVEYMRTKSIVIATLVLLTLAAGCHRKGGGGYLAPAPAPANSNVSR